MNIRGLLGYLSRATGIGYIPIPPTWRRKENELRAATVQLHERAYKARCEFERLEQQLVSIEKRW